MPQRVTQDEWDRRAEAAGLVWLEPVANSKTPVPAVCLVCNQQFSPIPGNVHSGQGCPRCGRIKAGQKKRVSQKVWDQRALTMSVEWLEPVTTSHRRTRARCIKCGHEWAVAPSKIGIGRACPKCGRIKAGLSRRVGADEWNRRAAAVGIEWLGPVRIKDEATLARCKTCFYQWEAIPKGVTQGHGCPNCAGVRPYTPNEWREFAARSGLTLHNEPRNQRDRAYLTCRTCGYSYETGAGGLVTGKGCPSCAGVLPLTQSEWAQRALDAGYDILEPVKNGHTPTAARCRKCGHRFHARLSNQSGCPACAEYGFNPSLPSLLYLLRHNEDGALKIGIAKTSAKKSSQSRLASHERNGWSQERVWHFDNGFDARSVEQAVLHWWRDDLGLPPAHKKGSGFTETVSADQMTIRRVVRFVNRTIKQKAFC